MAGPRKTKQGAQKQTVLQDTSQILQAIIRNSPLAIICTDLDANVLLWNPAAERIFGWSAEEALGRKNPIVPREKEAESRRLRESVRQGNPYRSRELMRQRKDGTLIRLNAASAAVYDADDTVVGLVGIFEDISELGRVQDALRESEKRFRDIVHTSREWIWESDTRNRITFSNPAVRDILGCHASEVIGREAFSLMEDETRKEVGDRLPALLREKRGWINWIVRMRHRDGGTRHLESSAIPLLDAGGTIIGYRGTDRDVTERVRMEAALRESEEKFSKVYQKAPLLITLSDIESGRFLDVNDKFEEVSGFSREEALGRTVLELGWLSKEQREKLLNELRERGRVEGMELLLRRKDGQEVDCLYNGEVITIKGQRMLLSIAQDITERKRTEQELREKESKYQVLFESANDGIFIHDETGFLDCNRKGAEMYGLPKEKVIGHLPGEFAPERQPDGRLSSEVAGEKIAAALGGTPQVFEWRPMRADGSLFDVEITLSRLVLGGKTRLQAIVRDSTERKRLEEELLKFQKLESVGTLAGGIAHDFNNLLQGVFGYLSMARMTIHQREKSLAMLEQAERSLHAAVGLTSQLLTFARGGKPLKKPMRLQPVIENAARLALSGSRAECRIDLGEGLPAVDADAGQIGQVVQNIVLNADQAMPEGGRVEISALDVQAPGPGLPPGLAPGWYAQVSVRDSGIGIPKQYQTKIFDPYFTTKEKGSGLGLATSYTIIRNHGGAITVSSEAGKGSVFTFYLPATNAPVEEPQSTAESAGSRKGRILVMDDESMVRNIVGEMIVLLGHEAVLAGNGAVALEQFHAAKEAGRPFDVVILDLTVRGGMGGAEVIEELLKTDPDVKAVVSSGYADNEVLASYGSYGFRATLNKPYKFDDLGQTLNALLK